MRARAGYRRRGRDRRAGWEAGGRRVPVPWSMRSAVPVIAAGGIGDAAESPRCSPWAPRPRGWARGS